MILCENKRDRSPVFTLLEKITKALTNKDVELTLINENQMRELNKTHRGIDKSTDVLSFPVEEFPHSPLGSIVINVDQAKSVAEQLNHSEDDEIALLYLHGLLHILGYDHEIDDGEMREIEEKMIREFDLPESLIVRSER